MGKPCVAGAEGIQVDVKLRQAKIGETILHEGDFITIDGGTGCVYAGVIPTIEPSFSNELNILLGWADEIAVLKVMANADKPATAKKALSYGGLGIGLCRTERMFNDPDRLPIVIEMILANTAEDRQAALNRLLPIQRQDFIEIFTTMAGRPVTVRLLDPPIHEFLPTEDELREELIHLRHLKDTASGVTDLFASLKLLHAETSVINSFIPFNDKGVELISEAIVKKEQMMKKVHDLHEVNPMLGHRGVRLGLTFPEIYKMQIQAILEAAAECRQAGLDVHPEIMVPQVCTAEELVRVKAYVDEIKEKIETGNNIKLVFQFGTMIEVVRACMEAEELAKQVEFFSFGTNDLTQATFSFSREDAENKFLPMYAEKHILWDNPFEVLDIKGVGKLMKVAVEWGRKTNPELKIGICGEHGGQPDSIKFCHDLGLTYVSCSSPRVPVARLAAAHAMLGKAKNTSL
jgi:pyruvate,orthophosphate dikinase